VTTGAVSDDREGTPPAGGIHDIDGADKPGMAGVAGAGAAGRGADQPGADAAVAAGGRAPGQHLAPGGPDSAADAVAAGQGNGGAHAPRHMARPAAPAVSPGLPPPPPPSPPARPGRHPRPASRRGRAEVRRRARLAVRSAPPAPAGPRAAATGRGNRPASSRAHGVRRRRALLLAGMGALTVAGVGLAAVGLSAVRTSTAGRYEQAAGPDDPGYQAHVVPTPTMGVLHRGADGSLVGASLLSLEPGDDGGSVIVVPPASIVPTLPGGPETTIAAVFADQGAAAAAQALGQVVTVAVSGYVEVDDAQWAQLVGPVGPLDLTVDEPVGDRPAGPVTLEPAEVGAFLSARAEGETDLDRLDRQQLFWNAWLPLVGSGGAEVLPGEVGSGIGRFVLGVSRGGGSAAALPVGRDDGDGEGDDEVRFRTDLDRIGDFVSRTVPYPTAPVPGGRIRVRLLNGTRDGSLTTMAARELVAAGAQISIAGNASTFDVTETSLLYAGADRAGLAEWLRINIGGGRVEEAPTGQDGQVPSDDEIDVTVILGDDAGDLIER
jgi:hypothetical protein